jgi:ABC-type nitrate/sulfonate/bicarbonate transport system substrate-binding protein
MFDWDKQIVRATIERAGENTGVQLQFLLMRLEQYPDALPAIAEAVEDMGAWCQQQAEALRAEGARRDAQAKLRAIVNTPQK